MNDSKRLIQYIQNKDNMYSLKYILMVMDVVVFFFFDNMDVVVVCD